MLGDLDRRGAILALARLHGHELNMADFAKAAELSGQPAKQLRIDLEGLGLIRVRETPVRGATLMTISLTPLGEEVARHLIAIDEILKKPRERSRK